MKSNALCAAVILIATLMITVLPTNAEAEIYEDTIRLHILAESDSEYDQKIKLALRDRLLLEYGERLSGYDNISLAEEEITALIPEIEDFCKSELEKLGFAGSVACTLTTEWYDTREYESFTLPEGYYRSLRVIIGEGEGRNWWCVMYPPLCLDIATEDESCYGEEIYSDSELRLIRSGKYNVKFKLLEAISHTFKK